MASARGMTLGAGRRRKRGARDVGGGVVLFMLLIVLLLQMLVPMSQERRDRTRQESAPETQPAPSWTAAPAAPASDDTVAAAPDPSPARPFMHTLKADTAFLHSAGEANAETPLLDVLEAGTPVTLLEFGNELSLVRTVDGVQGRVPTVRLTPQPGVADPNPRVQPDPSQPAEDASPPFRPLAEPPLLVGANLLQRGASRRIDPARVQEAIDAGVRYLQQAQNRDGSWDPAPGTLGEDPIAHANYGALTALATLTLLSAGETPRDPRIGRALEFLRGQEMRGTYARSLRARVWPLLGADRLIRESAAGDAKWLLESVSTRNDASRGFYGYWWDPVARQTLPVGHYDRSNSQFAVQGVLAGAAAGVEVPAEFWELQELAWARAQNPAGGWEYTGQGASTRAMTAAGVSTMITVQDFTRAAADARCDGNPDNPTLHWGLDWLDRHLVNFVDTGDFYLLNEVSRAGRLAGRRYFGNTDWFAEGADWLLRQQHSDGSWGGRDAGRNPGFIPDTCFALQFLLRGRVAPAMGKLSYAGDWNQRPRDVAKFTAALNRDLPGEPAWQVVGLATSPLEDFFDVPVLYVSGRAALDFDAAAVRKLKAYVEGGGLILGNADCGKRAFADSFTALGRRMFPQLEFRALPPDHPIHTRQQFPDAGWPRRVRLHGLSDGVRELMLLVPDDDIGRLWTRGIVDAGYQGANIVSYATGARRDK